MKSGYNILFLANSQNVRRSNVWPHPNAGTLHTFLLLIRIRLKKLHACPSKQGVTHGVCESVRCNQTIASVYALR